MHTYFTLILQYTLPKNIKKEYSPIYMPKNIKKEYSPIQLQYN